MAAAAAVISQGDLSKPGLTESDDDMGKIATSFNSMVASLRKMMTHSQGVTEQVSTASVEISTAAQEQLTSLNETVSALNEVASTAEEFKTTIQEFADRARSVQEATGETASQAREGRTAAQKSAEETEAVRDDIRAAGESVLHFANQMQRITEITDMVNEIAEQTKLLALNASIEAARAGEEGKGFAVVATQVRELASQSKDAARNISSLIADTQRSLQAVVNRIEQGTHQSDETAATVRAMADQFEEFVEAFTQTADAMTQITGAAQQQEEGIVQLVSGLAQIETASKETVTSAEQTQKAIGEIDRQTTSLNATMQKFKV
jgi:methyl-accepting chemotaxis protein